MRLQVSGVMRTGRERQNENRNIGPDGSERWVAWTNKRRQEADGTLLHSVGRDITERKRAERALRANQAFLHRTSELAGVGGWEIDLRSGETIWSEQVRRILDVDEDHLPRQDDAVASDAPEARETLRKALADCMKALVGTHVREVLRGKPQAFDYGETLHGDTRRIRTQLIPDVGEDGRVRGFYATSIDVTEGRPAA